MYLMLIFFFVALKGVLFSKFGLNFYNYGETLHNAVRVLDGQVLYKDIWSFFPPGFNYFPALIFEIFGPDLLIVRFIESLIFALLVVAIIQIAKEFLTRGMNILLSMVLAFSDVNTYLFFYYVFFFLALLCLTRFVKTQKTKCLVYSGILTGTGFFFRHDTAAVTSITVVATLIICKYKKIIKERIFILIFSFSLGALLASSGVLLLIVHSVSLTDFARLAFLEAPRISKTLSPGIDLSKVLPFQLSIAYAIENFTLIYYALFFGIYIITAIKLYGEIKTLTAKDLIKRRVGVIVLLIFGILSIPHTISVFELGHLVKAGMPAIILGFFLLQEFIRRKDLIKSILTCLFIGNFLIASLVMSFWWIRFNDTKVRFKSGEVYLNSEYKSGSTHPSAGTVIKSVEFIKNNTSEDEYIFVAPYHAMLYFLSERKSPTKFNNFAAGILTKQEEDELLVNLEEKNVRVVVYDPKNAPHNRKFSDYSPAIDKYLMENFEVVEKTQENWLFMKRK